MGAYAVRTVRMRKESAVDRQRTGQAVAGTMLVGVGLILLGDRLGWGPQWNMKQLWPVLVMIFGLAQLVSSEDGRWRRGMFFVFFGLVFLLDRLHVMSIRESWPLFIVSAGISMLFGHRRCQTPKPVARHGE